MLKCIFVVLYNMYCLYFLGEVYVFSQQVRVGMVNLFVEIQYFCIGFGERFCYMDQGGINYEVGFSGFLVVSGIEVFIFMGLVVWLLEVLRF